MVQQFQSSRFTSIQESGSAPTETDNGSRGDDGIRTGMNVCFVGLCWL